MLQEQEEQKLPIRKDCEVEVCSEEEGFVGAWYRAILEESPTKSKRKKLRVRYTTLLQDDYSTPLIETVHESFIRPVPPEDLSDGVVFEEGSVIDADLKDGWWNGVVVKKMEDDKFLVYFHCPPDIVQFDRKQLRSHLEWTGSKWVRAEPKSLEMKELSKSLFSSGTMVEVSLMVDKLEAVWVPAVVIEEIEVDDEKKFLVKHSCNKSLTSNADEANPIFTVDPCNVRPSPSPPAFAQEYKLLDRVDAFRGLGWRQGLVRGILSDKRYAVSFLVTKEESVFKHSDLRPSKEWEDGVWHQGPKRNSLHSVYQRNKSITFETTLSEINALRRPKKLNVIRCSTAAKPPITPKRTTKRTRKSPSPAEATEGETALHQTVAAKELPITQESGTQIAATPQVMPIEKESAPSETSVIKATLAREPEAETQGMASPEKTLQPMQNGLGMDSTGKKTYEEHTSEEDSHKRKRVREHDSNLKETEALITVTSDNMSDDDDDKPLSAWTLGAKSSNGSDKSKYGTLNADETRGNEDTTMVLPFAKHSPIWKVLESMEAFTTVKQSPHFIPLLETREEFREGSAVGEMVKFSSLLERVKNLEIHTHKSTLEGLKECFFELEKHGFDVRAPITRIDMLFSLKDKQVNAEKKRKDNEKQMTEEASKKLKVEEDLRDVERKILELRSQEADMKERKEASDKEIAQMQVCAEALEQMIQDLELEFQDTVSAPW